MKHLKVYSMSRPEFALTAETYTIKDGVKGPSQWYSEVPAEDYATARARLEQAGYTAHPASTAEIESGEYSIFW